MGANEKKILLLLKAVIFQYHGLDNEENNILKETANRIDGDDELLWAMDFVNKDEPTSLSRAREFLVEHARDLGEDVKLEYLEEVWVDNNRKGYITELEATGLLKIAKDWNLQTALLNIVRQKINK